MAHPWCTTYWAHCQTIQGERNEPTRFSHDARHKKLVLWVVFGFRVQQDQLPKIYRTELLLIGALLSRSCARLSHIEIHLYFRTKHKMKPLRFTSFWTNKKQPNTERNRFVLTICHGVASIQLASEQGLVPKLVWMKQLRPKDFRESNGSKFKHNFLFRATIFTQNQSRQQQIKSGPTLSLYAPEPNITNELKEQRQR